MTMSQANGSSSRLTANGSHQDHLQSGASNGNQHHHSSTAASTTSSAQPATSPESGRAAQGPSSNGNGNGIKVTLRRKPSAKQPQQAATPPPVQSSQQQQQQQQQQQRSTAEQLRQQEEARAQLLYQLQSAPNSEHIAAVLAAAQAAVAKTKAAPSQQPSQQPRSQNTAATQSYSGQKTNPSAMPCARLAAPVRPRRSDANVSYKEDSDDEAADVASAATNALSSTSQQTATPAVSPSKASAVAGASKFITPSNKGESADSGKGSNTTTSPVAGQGRVKPRKTEQTFVSSRTFEPLPKLTRQGKDAMAQPAKEGGMKRVERKTRAKANEESDDPSFSNSAWLSGYASLPPKTVVHGAPNPAHHPARKSQHVQPDERLPLQTADDDLASKPTVPTYVSSERYPPPRTRPRLFELEDCPTFRPTWAEFSDPMKYIDWVGSPQGGNGKAYGIAKIVPPEGWHPEFVMDQQQFRFHTRVQELNSLSADARATLNYQEQLQKFHSQQGRSRVSIPVIDRRPLDLYQLKLGVKHFGGFENLSRSRKWPDLARHMGYPDKDASQLSSQIKAAYVKIIHPFEQFLARARDQAKQRGGSSSSANPRQGTNTPAVDEGDSLAAGGGMEETGQTEADTSLNSKRRSVRKRSDATTQSRSVGSNNSRGARRARLSSREVDPDSIVTLDGAEEQMCEICLRGDNGVSMLLCDECNRGYHMYCLEPPLTTVPKSQWYCPPCLMGTGNDYGFEDGETHSLNSFWKRATAFRRHWFTERPQAIWDGKSEGSLGHANADGVVTESASSSSRAPNGMTRPIAGTDLVVAEDDVEREFWRLVENPNETVEVEYGADIRATTHGSALPTMETHPMSPYSRDGWNLNNLPIAPASLLRYIRSDISGMTVPWIYVGMIFSTFCWHNEDHYTYSINYQHWGDTKTWYGVPGEDAEKFEDAMRKAAPDLFETSPDLLFQLVTMMSPAKLKKEGVRVYACDQRANEFVVTYPKAYHSGFNQGFNFNEAVNFALPDWVDLDLECVRRYQQFQKNPVFSHDELLVTASQQSSSIATATWLQHSYREMVQREIAARKAIRTDVPGMTEIVEDRDRSEAESQCAYCRCFCYLTQVTSPKADGVACLDHPFKVCGADSPTNWTLRLRFSDEQLEASLQKVVDRADQPVQWQQRYRKLLMAHRRPPLRNLRGLLQEGERIAVKLSEVEQLREFVDKANDWVQQATKHMPKRYGGRPSNNLTTPAADESSDAIADNVDRSPAAIEALLKEVDRLAFDAPEIGALREALVGLQDMSKQCGSVLARIQSGEAVPLVECEETLAAIGSFNVDLPELHRLQRYVAGRKWIAEMDEIHENHINLEEVRELIAEFKSTDLDESHRHYADLRQRLVDGEDWERKATEVLEDRPNRLKTLDGLQYLTTTPNRIPVVPAQHDRLEKLLNQGREWTKAIRSLLDATKKSGGVDTQYMAEARKVLRAITAARIQIPHAQKLKDDIEMYDEWKQGLVDTVVFVMNEEAMYEQNRTVHKAALDAFCTEMDRCSDPNDALLPLERQDKTSPQCFERVPYNDQEFGQYRCEECKTWFHNKCGEGLMPLNNKTSNGRGSQQSSVRSKGAWVCPLCNPADLPKALNNRRAIDLSLIERLVYDPKYTQMRFIPADYEQLRQSCLNMQRMAREARSFLRQKPDPFVPEIAARYRHLLCRMMGAPVDIKADSQTTVIMACVQALFRLHNLDVSGNPQRSVTATAAATPSSGGAITDAKMAEGDRSTAAVEARKGSVASTQDVAASNMADTSQGSPVQRPQEHTPDLKRKRGKRAKLVFKEEVGIWVPVNGYRIYCLCHQKETGTMISCDRCMLWFHNSCVHVADPKDIGDSKWHCPMCCVKTEKKYPFAEVKVRDPNVSDPHMWLDIRTSLRSGAAPVSKLQQWTSPLEKRIVLHLDSFFPAISAEGKTGGAQHESVKRQRLDSSGVEETSRTLATPSSVAAGAGALPANSAAGKPSPAPPAIMSYSRKEPSSTSSAETTDRRPVVPPPGRAPSAARPPTAASMHPQPPSRVVPPARQQVSSQPSAVRSPTGTERDAEAERHRQGMQNLYSRGVTDAMIHRWYVGWNGRTLVYPRYDSKGQLVEVDLGSRIQLDPDDEDGSRFISRVLDRERQQRQIALEQRRAAEHRHAHQQYWASHPSYPVDQDGYRAAPARPLPPMQAQREWQGDPRVRPSAGEPTRPSASSVHARPVAASPRGMEYGEVTAKAPLYRSPQAAHMGQPARLSHAAPMGHADHGTSRRSSLDASNSDVRRPPPPPSPTALPHAHRGYPSSAAAAPRAHPSAPPAYADRSYQVSRTPQGISPSIRQGQYHGPSPTMSRQGQEQAPSRPRVSAPGGGSPVGQSRPPPPSAAPRTSAPGMSRPTEPSPRGLYATPRPAPAYGGGSSNGGYSGYP
ncbi:unnamed protein product [Jaminaea pallidilutea]